jgi:hypothetical protein
MQFRVKDERPDDFDDTLRISAFSAGSFTASVVVVQ